jgi:magnesium-transporting ATPase (P-type)
MPNVAEDKQVIVDNNNFLLRGCSLRQTESVLCFVVYAGKNTKIMQNSPGARAKTSSIEKRMNLQIKFIFFFQIFLGLLASLFSLSQILTFKKDPAPYIYKDKKDRPFNFEEYSKKFNKILSGENMKKIFGKNNSSLFSMIGDFFKEIRPIFNLDVLSFLLIKLGTWCVLLNNLVPISLLMTLELVKYFQGFFISWDIDIYDKSKKVTTKVQTSTLNEELGQVKYIFSDKTGTLTKNYMKFKRVSIGLKQYNQKQEPKDEDEIDEINNINIINGKEDELNKIDDNKNKESVNKEQYKDEYGKIKHVTFDDDKEFIKDLGIADLIKKDNEQISDKDINNNKLYDNENMENINLEKVDNEKKDDLIDNDNDREENELSDDNLKIEGDVSQKDILDLFMTACATCHSGVIEEKQFQANKKLVYQSSSPDEVAILNFTRKYKYIFLGRKNNKITIKKPINSVLTEVTYKIPFQFEYTSERKSMSVVVQNSDNPDEIYLFMKGADSVILPKLDHIDEINRLVIPNLRNSLDIYAKEGLRILAVAYKKLTLEECTLLQNQFIKASKSTYEKKQKLEKLAGEVEKNLIFLGVTAIEDELQDDVNQTLKDFSSAGIKLWVLTGDKRDTAKSIAYSCGLFDDEKFNIFEIKEGLTKTQLEARLNELVDQFNNLVDKMDKNENPQSKVLFLSKSEMNIRMIPKDDSKKKLIMI